MNIEEKPKSKVVRYRITWYADRQIFIEIRSEWELGASLDAVWIIWETATDGIVVRCNQTDRAVIWSLVASNRLQINHVITRTRRVCWQPSYNIQWQRSATWAVLSRVQYATPYMTSTLTTQFTAIVTQCSAVVVGCGGRWSGVVIARWCRSTRVTHVGSG